MPEERTSILHAAVQKALPMPGMGAIAMRIFFLMRSSIYLRNYESVVRLLAANGHEVHLGFSKIDPVFSEDAVAQLVDENSNISYAILPIRDWLWRRPAEFVRKLQTYVRFLDERYKDTHKLKARAESLVPKRFRNLLQVTIGSSDPKRWALIEFLRNLERAIPLNPFTVRYLKKEQPDVFLITPLVNMRAKQLDWLKSAKSLGIKSGLCVASWDNLTSKSLIQSEPDLVFVWNEIQKREALEFHHIPASKIVVTGAQCYDRLFAQRSSTSGKAFLEKVGLEQEEPYLLYLCSSAFIAPREVEFISEWIERLRNSGDARLERIGVLVRPHPQNSAQWNEVDFTHFHNVSIFPRRGAAPIRGQSFNDFYDSMFHSFATVGINTSPMIESGILNKPVFTILAPQFKDTQEGTIHFAHLVEGGLLNVSHDLDEHVRQLIKVLDGEETYHERIREFIQSFVRPHGIQKECTPLFVKALEDLNNGMMAPTADRAKWGFLIRASLFPWAAVYFTYSRVKERMTGWFARTPIE
jgi:hypothetical protein